MRKLKASRCKCDAYLATVLNKEDGKQKSVAADDRGGNEKKSGSDHLKLHLKCHLGLARGLT